MSAQLSPPPVPAAQMVAMDVASLDAIVAIEVAAYDFPWSRGNFVDSIAAGYLAQRRVDAEGGTIGYFIAMPGVQELHLLNLTVAPARQGRGHGRAMLDALVPLARESGATSIWLEVRPSNLTALALYERYGFRRVGLRRGYYPAPQGRREDAIVMSLRLPDALQAGVP
jgi:ribosomal-protein-alanine N-acetyltransferase